MLNKQFTAIICGECGGNKIRNKQHAACRKVIKYFTETTNTSK